MPDPLPLTPLDDRRAVGRFNPKLRRVRISGAGQVDYPIRHNAPSRCRTKCGQSADKVEWARKASERVRVRSDLFLALLLSLVLLPSV